MITVLRILFGIGCIIVFLFLGILTGSFLQGRGRDKNVTRDLALIFNTVLLAVFFTLWCVQRGVI